MKSSSKLISVLLLSICLPPLVGCTEFDLRRPIPWVNDDKNDPKAPGDVVVFWQNAIRNQAGQRPTRGVGGRVMFHDQKKGAPTKVEGTLVVYVFDERDRKPGDNRPTRKHIFPAEQFAKYYSESELGHSYSIWVPWDEAPGPTTEISLLARFIPPDGMEVISGQAKVILPGHDFPPAELVDHRRNGSSGDESGVHTVSYDKRGDAEEVTRKPTGRMTSTTIKIPPRFGSTMPSGRTRTRPAANASTIHAPTAQDLPPVHSTEVASTTPAVNRPVIRNGRDRTRLTPSTKTRMSLDRLRTAAAPTAPRASPSTGPRSTHFAPARPRPQASSIAGLTRDRAPSQPSRSTWRSPWNQSELPTVTVSGAN